MKKNLLTITITFLLLIISSSGCIDNNLDAGYESIQESIDNANEGDTIYIRNGIYYETIVINKSITLIGEGEDKTIIDCKKSIDDHVDMGALESPYKKPSTGIEGIKERFPIAFNLDQNYPNPFNPATTIKYALPKSEHVTLSVYNTLGQNIETLVDKYMPIGHHQVIFNGQHLPSGVYFYRLEAGEYIQTRKMLLVR